MFHPIVLGLALWLFLFTLKPMLLSAAARVERLARNPRGGWISKDGLRSVDGAKRP
jgi:hypothetical protein